MLTEKHKIQRLEEENERLRDEMLALRGAALCFAADRNHAFPHCVTSLHRHEIEFIVSLCYCISGSMEHADVSFLVQENDLLQNQLKVCRRHA